MREARGKRSLRIGTLLPNIVLYNDPTPHPSTSNTTTVISADLARKPDLLLIFGTSLKVHGIKKLVRDFAKQVHLNKGSVIFINKCPLGTAEWSKVIDYWVEGDCDSWIHDLKLRIPNLWTKQEVLPVMPVIKPTPKKDGISVFFTMMINVLKCFKSSRWTQKIKKTARRQRRGSRLVMQGLLGRRFCGRCHRQKEQSTWMQRSRPRNGYN